MEHQQAAPESTTSGAETTGDGSRSGAATDRESETTVEVRPTGHVRGTVGEPRLEYTFEGKTLREFLDAFFEEYDVREMLIAETDAEATTDGWAPTSGDPPGEWNRNPEGEDTRRYARVTVNGRFNEHLDGLDTELSDGDRIGLIYPFMFCV